MVAHAPPQTATKSKSSRGIWLGIIGFVVAAGSIGSLSPWVAILITIGLTGIFVLLFVKKIGPSNLRTPILFGAIAAALGTAMAFSSAAREAEKAEAARVQAEAAERNRQDALARLPGLLDEARAAVEAKDWKKAATAYENARFIDPNSVQSIAAEWAKAEAALKAIKEREAKAARDKKEAQEEAARQSAYASAIEDAESVVKDQKLCDTPSALGDAWKKLREIERDEPAYAKAKKLVPRMEKCRIQQERELAKAVRQLRSGLRVATAQKLDTAFLDQGIDADVRVTGESKDVLRITWILMNRANAHQMTNGGAMHEGSFLHNLQTGGFRKVVFSDGHDFGYYYDLKPEDEAKAGKLALTESGLDQPLRLP